MKRSLCAAFVVCGSVVFAQQQQQTPEMIPKDLVKLLLGSGTFMSNLDVVVGLPEAFPPELMPRGAKALIATTSPSSSMVVAEVPEWPAESQRYERQLANAGWTLAPAYSGMTRGGLLPNPPVRASTVYCNADRQFNYILTSRAGAPPFMRLSLTKQSRPGPPCTPNPSTSSYGSGIASEVELPPLLPPATATTESGGGSSMSSDYMDQRMRMQTSAPVAEVLQHYREQIEKYGWKYESQAVADGAGIVRFSLMSTKQQPVISTLSVVALPGQGMLEVGLYLSRATTRR